MKTDDLVKAIDHFHKNANLSKQDQEILNILINTVMDFKKKVAQVEELNNINIVIKEYNLMYLKEISSLKGKLRDITEIVEYREYGEDEMLDMIESIVNR